VIHRDIKPGNLLLGSDGRLSINDFGLARALEEPGMTATGEFVGTPAYLAPEQIAGGRIPVDHRCDIYSLGATLYELLTLQPPFVADRRDQLLAMVIQKEPAAPRRANPAVPRDLETICLKCLEKDPDRRYRTAQELADDLRRFVNRFAISARRAGPLARARKWARRNPALAGACLAVLLALVAAGGFAWQARESERHRREDQRRAALNKAMEEALNGNYPEALRQIARAKELDATEAELAKVRGIVALYQGDLAAATVHFEEAHKHAPSVATRALLARALLDQLDLRFEVPFGDLAAAQPQTFEDHLFRGDLMCLWGDLRGLDDLKRAIELDPRSPVAWLARAEAQFTKALDSGSLADAEEAVRDADRARDLLPGCYRAQVARLMARLVLWDCLADADRVKHADRLAQLDQELDGLLSDARPWRGIQAPDAAAHYHDRRGRHEQWEQHLTKLWNVRDPWAGIHLAYVFVRDEKFPQAKEAVETVRKLGRGKSWPHAAYILTECDPKDRDTAFAEVKASANSATDVLSLAQVALVLGKPDEARAAFLRVAGTPFFRWIRRGWVEKVAKYGTGEQIDILTEAGTSRLNLCEAHYVIGLRYLADGHRDDAKKQFERAVRTRVFIFSEYRSAGRFLARIDRARKNDDPPWPPWIPPEPKR
jgi:tetratricopeptide (TPR) repeat protein